MQYIRRPEDEKYRRVLLTQTQEPPYTPFTEEKQMISYTENTVLEILDSHGTSRLEYDDNGEKNCVVYTKMADRIRIQATMPLARLWLRDSNGMDYKIPTNLPMDPDAHSCVYFKMNQWGQDAAVVGDRYFEKVCDITYLTQMT